MTARSPWLRLVLLSAVLLGCGDREGEAQSADPAPDAPQAPAQQEAVDLGQLGFDEGAAAEAVIGVAEFSDFGCVHCANFHIGTYPTLYEEFVATGDVLWKYVPISVGSFPNGDLAAYTGICAGSMGAFASMRDHLFENREEWLSATSDEARQIFQSYAVELGLDAGAVSECLDDPDTAARLQRNNDISREAGVGGTPTFVIQGQLVPGAPPLEDFQEALERIVAQVREEAARTTPDAAAPDTGDTP